MKFCFGDIVVVDGENIGVVVKGWINQKDNSHTYEVYVRLARGLENTMNQRLNGIW